ncbi:hypothetical protein ACQEVZ_55275 [Dactylosporangium sp. CA-152071]|uniref:hypothetical protein n=1 Tax=Dactylosporangium sp. CA-152071 TaxID=3239933 RepID=UPI003D8A773C
MSDMITWVEPQMTILRGRLRPNFADDDRFNAAWWGQNAGIGPPAHQWRSYIRRGEEAARLLLSFSFRTHSLDSAERALMIWSFEVRQDLRCSGSYVGTNIINQLVDEYRDREIYIGSSPSSATFWARFGWPMCDCDECEGRGFIVHRP